MVVVVYECDGGFLGIFLGLKVLDEKFGGLYLLDFIIFVGCFFMGKILLVINIVFDVVKNYQYEIQLDGIKKIVNGGVVGFYLFEMLAEQFVMCLIVDYIGIFGYMICQGMIDVIQYEEICDVVLEIQSLLMFIDDIGGLFIFVLVVWVWCFK